MTLVVIEVEDPVAVVVKVSVHLLTLDHGAVIWLIHLQVLKGFRLPVYILLFQELIGEYKLLQAGLLLNRNLHRLAAHLRLLICSILDLNTLS